MLSKFYDFFFFYVSRGQFVSWISQYTVTAYETLDRWASGPDASKFYDFLS